MEGDGCFLCKAAEKSLRNVSSNFFCVYGFLYYFAQRNLNCERYVFYPGKLACEENPESEVCYKQASLGPGQTSQEYSSPVLLQV